MFELWSLVQQQMGQTVEQNAHTLEYVQLATTALSDLMFYPAPVIFTLNDFQQIQASVFQVARTPGKYIVYLGCLLLILGIFAMFYIRQRRAWIWISTRMDHETQHPSPQQHTELIFALTAVRRTLDFDREFIALQDQLRKICN
jgi:cytochrome c biogenesis protein